MTNKATIKLELGEKNLDRKLEQILENIPKEMVKDLLSLYYSRTAQQMINDKTYSDLVTLEGLSSLHAMIDNLG